MPYNDSSTNITFSSVRDNAATIRNCSSAMSSMFDEFGGSVRELIVKGAFVGSAADTFEDKFNSLKTKFDSYTRVVEEFATMISSAANSTEQTQKDLENQASNLAG